MIANLHMHSIYSDGAETPEKLAERAIENNIELISLTDHNTFDGYDRFSTACEKNGIMYIKGVEINAAQPEFNYKSEILAYFPNGGSEKIEPLLKSTREWRTKREIIAIERAAKLFNIKNLCYTELSEKALIDRGFNGMISNKMIYQYICSKGIELPSYPIFQNTQAWKQIWSMEKANMGNLLSETIETITNAGGFAVMPHFGKHCHFDPQFMRKEEAKLLSELSFLKDRGLWGVEMHPYRYLPQADGINQIVRNWAEKIGLNITYGSDYHGGISVHNQFDGMTGEFEGFTNI